MDFWNNLNNAIGHHLDLHIDIFVRSFGLRSEELFCISGLICGTGFFKALCLNWCFILLKERSRRELEKSERQRSDGIGEIRRSWMGKVTEITSKQYEKRTVGLGYDSKGFGWP